MTRLKWRWWAGLAGLTALGGVLRIHQLGSNSFWLDEAISVLIARLPASLILSNAGHSSHPGLYYLLLHYWLPSSGAEVWGRALSVLWGALTVPAIFVLGTLLFNRKVALVASALLALAPFHVAYSQEARMYAQLTFLGVVALTCFHRAIESGHPGWWLATGMATTAAAATHLFVFLLLAAVSLYVLLYRRDALVKMILIDLGAVIVVAPHLATMLGGTPGRLGGLRPLVGKGRPNPLFPITATHVLLVGYSITAKVMPVALLCSLSTFAIALWETGQAIRRRSERWRSLVLLLLIVGMTLLGPFGLAQIRPIFLPERTLLIGLPAMILLIAWGVSEAKRMNPLPGVGIGLVVVMLLSLWGYYVNPAFQKPPMREAATLVQERLDAGDAILHTSDGSYLPFLVYVDHPDHFLLQGDPDPRKSEAVYRIWGGQLASKGELNDRFERLWVVMALDHSVEFQREALAWFKSRYALLERHNVGGIGIYLLDLTASELESESDL
jgi:uncharacterized membrane protein